MLGVCRSLCTVLIQGNGRNLVRFSAMSGGAGEQGCQGNGYTVCHDKVKSEFYIDLEGDGACSCQERALLEYEWTESNLADLYHTLVPESMRGKGIAKHLAKAAMDYMVQEDVKMRLSCTYLQKYFREHPLPEYVERVVS